MNVEFVSANPTGPLHVGHGRQAALGDAIATLLEWTGWKVSREFYYNDAGVQIENLAASVHARVRELAGEPLAIPEGGYHGEYIREIAERFVRARGGDARSVSASGEATPRRADHGVQRFAVAELRDEQDLDLQAFGVRFDTYFLESSLYTDGQVERTVRAFERDRPARTSRKARSGCAPPSSATTRTASCASATARTRTSCPTSPIT